ncbi:MAG TPA: class I SAM-dependent methyltransferase [Opitutaceae bacterium]|nr:class I SAM-dependent methyltransferase [Opitutaceae bacterium]
MADSPANSSIILADKWQDYQLLDCGAGMKQERWGEYVLVRPDPQILWPRRGRAEWKDWDGFYHRSAAGGGEWEFRRKLPESWTVRYGALTFKIRPTNFKHTGLFPEQAANWDWFSAKIRAAGRPVSVLNLFGYTGAATVAAATAGASVCHVDAAKGMVEWCRENAALSGLAEAPVRYIVDDCRKFVQREIRRGRTYDAVIMDPPTYGRGGDGEMWKLEDDLWELLADCRKVLSERPLFFLINAYTARLSPTVVVNLLRELFADGGGTISGGEVGLPVASDGKILPCGIHGRWECR